MSGVNPYGPESNSSKTVDENGNLKSRKARASRAGTRSVANLSPAQLARKRANDREAQRSIRQRTKEHIESLQSRIRDLQSKNGNELLGDALRRNRELEEELRQLRSSLALPDEGKFVASVPSNVLNSSVSPSLQAYDRPSPVEQTQIGSLIPPQSADTWSVNCDPSAPIGSGFGESFESGSGTIEMAPSSLPTQYEQYPPTIDVRGEPPLLRSTSMVSPSGDNQWLYSSQPSRVVDQQQPLCSANVQRRGWEVPVQVLPSLGLVNSILIGLVQDQKNLGVNGGTVAEMIGPYYASLRTLLYPDENVQRTSLSHPIPTILSKLILQTGLRGITARAARLVTMHRLVQWQIYPSETTYSHLTNWQSPQASQLITSHPDWTSYIIWDKLRERVIGNLDTYGTEEFYHLTALMGTEEYIERVVGTAACDETDSDLGTTAIKNVNGKRKAEEETDWFDDGDNPYERFKNRKSIARKKTTAAKKKLKQKMKERKEQGNKKMWGEDSDSDMMKDSLPEYLQERRKELDRNQRVLNEAGLKLPPNYDDIDFSDDERLRDLEERPDFPGTVEQSRAYKDIELPTTTGVIPASIAQYLRDYQIDGVRFLHELFIYQRGGILGDDMGLGKTVQVAAFLTVAFGKTGDERDDKRMRKMRRSNGKPWYPRVLIVCPGSLMQNWKNELTRWGYWHLDIFHGDAGRKEAVLSSAISGRVEIVITTYMTYKNHKNHLNMVQWDCIVADECHQFKETKSQVTQAMNEVNALCRIGLTGTAIQNKYEELWTLLNWTNPGRFGPLSVWESSISEPLRIGQSHNATLHQLKTSRETANRLVQNLLPQFFLRRMKSLIAHQLPKKTDQVVFCTLTEKQRNAYELFLNSNYIQFVKGSGEPCECDSGKSAGACCHSKLPDSNTKWQKLSNHLALLIPNSSDARDKQERDLEFLKTMVPDRWEELYQNRESLFYLSNPEFCGKWKVLKKLLKFWHSNGDKVLIFSHSVRLLKMLQHLFNNTSYNVSFLSGSMPNEDRQKTVDDFNTDPAQFVFLISTRAGGVGLNITSANKVVIFDPNWNPSYDLQAQDRAYRIGQLRDVEVVRLVSAGTVEEIVYARQIYKQQQANIGYNASLERRYFKGVQNSVSQRGEIFGLENLLTFHGDSFILRDIVNKTNVAEAKYGVDMIEVDMEEALNDDDNPLKIEDDNGDGAMSQLVALLTERDANKVKKESARPKINTIQAILASAGVQYTHENSEVVGSSKVETHLSRRAEETGNDVGYGEEMLFAETSNVYEPGKIQYEYHPPEDVMMRQFCTMAKTFGFNNAIEFALVVEGWTQKQRTDCLDRFYLKRKEIISELEKEDSGRGVSDGVQHSFSGTRNVSIDTEAESDALKTGTDMETESDDEL
ncbi:hypothetical protein B7494_g695 [Chlorociboria aeruginascens]|nr:hypothetical protein B7494_g695 [Chlorociboria aeruginascens]